jgi:hypothetical protein
MIEAIGDDAIAGSVLDLCDESPKATSPCGMVALGAPVWICDDLATEGTYRRVCEAIGELRRGAQRTDDRADRSLAG